MKALSLACCSLLLVAHVSAAEKSSARDHGKMEEETRLQIFLDRANFGPGKLDGRGGEFTRKALQLYRQAQSAQQAAAPEGAAPPQEEKKPEKKTKSDKEQLDTARLDLQSVNPVFITYTVTRQDVEGIGEAPKDPAGLAKLKAVPYRSVLEAVAERFHSDIDFVKELNPQVAVDQLKEGDTVTVPNVEPFDLATVKDIKPGEAFAPKEDPATSEDPEVKASRGGKEEEKASEPEKEAKDQKQEKPAGPKIAVRIDVAEKMLHVLKDGQLHAAFPVTPGSDDIPTPVGEWKVKGVARMPDFRHDEKMLKEGQRGDQAHLIPPGPNNPVGVIWIALNRPGIGIHGTDEPDTIGRAASHGCIRLANWDAVKVAKMVKGGVPVSIR